MSHTEKKTQFPTQQMVILAICRFAEPVAVTSVNPYIPEMVASFNVPTDKIGMYSGWLAAVFSLCQALTGITWGRASDKLGRKPMILVALGAVMLSTIAFGFSTSLVMAFITRSIQGASSGNVGILRTAVAEMVPQRELQPRAFSVMPLVWNIGSIFGPSLGGFLSNPQRRGWFEQSKLFRKFPYALPNLVISIFFLIGIVSGVLFLKESHNGLKNRRDHGLLVGSLMTSSCSRRRRRHSKRFSDEANPFLSETGSPMSTPMTPSSKFHRPSVESTRQHTWGDIFSRQSSINLIVYTGLAMHSMAFDQLVPVFMHHPVQTPNSSEVQQPLRFVGGFGMNSSEIGVIYTIYGTFGMFVQFFLFPPLARKFGILKCFKFCAVVFPFVYVSIPFTSLLTTPLMRQSVCLALMLVKCAVGIFSFPCSIILLTNSAVSLSVLGTLNGVATSMSAAGRAAGPALMGWIFTIGVDSGYIVMPFWTMAVVAILSAIPVWWLIELEGPHAKAGDLDDVDVSEDDRDRPFEQAEEEQLLRRRESQEAEAEALGSTSGLGISPNLQGADLIDNNETSTTTRPRLNTYYEDSNRTSRSVTSPNDTGMRSS